jgi:uncharacterized membrane protein
MRRLLATTVLSLAALGLATPAQAAVKCYGVTYGGNDVGACAGTWCPDVCFIVAEPHCTVPALGLDCTSH